MFTRKRISMMFACVALAVTTVVGQGPTLTASGGKEQAQQTYNGYDYELWSQNGSGTSTMQLTGDNGSGANAKGGTFTAQWSGTVNVLFRSGKRWGSNSSTTPKSVGNITIDFAATWTSGDNVKMLGVYGWAYFPSGSQPSNFSDQIEYYIIQDRGSYNSAAQGTNSSKKGSATIDGIVYDFYVCDRIGQPMLTGNGNFKQYFSVPASTGGHRTSGTITVSKHFEAWEAAGMKMMDCRLYEVAMKVESYTGSAGGSGNANVTKNILTLGGSGGSVPAGNFTLTATPSPAAGGKITKTPNADSYAPNTSVSLAATANAGWKFVRWEGGATGTTSPVSVNMNANKTVTAVFSQAEDGTNLVKNGSFTNTDNWTLNKWQQSAGTFAVSGGNANITGITKPSGEGAAEYSLQLVQNGIPLYKDAKYSLTFDASAASARDIGIVVQMDEDPYTTYFGKDVSLTTAKQSFKMDFDMKDADDENGRLAFNLGGSDANVTISNVKLIYTTTSTSIRDCNKAAVVRSSHAPMISVKGAMLNVSSSAGAGKDLKLRVVDVKGKTVAKFSAVGGGKYSLAKIPAGRYIVELKGVGIKQTSAIIVK